MKSRKLVHVIDVIRPGGGPYGYLYNLHDYMGGEGNRYGFEVMFDRAKIDRESGGGKSLKRFPNFVFRWAKSLRLLLDLLGLRRFPREEEILSEGDSVYCAHMVTLAARLLRRTKGSHTICAMPHGPISFSDEQLNYIEALYGADMVSALARKILNRIERRVLARCNALIVASEFGLDGYFDGKGLKHPCMFSVVSGVPEFKVEEKRESIRRELNIPEGKRVFGFFGRYVREKGFDKFLDVAARFRRNDGVFFVSAGAGPLKSVPGINYLDLGWRTDVARVISACDFIVLPNRQTYFDLLPLEALSIGIPVIASDVGGNKTLSSMSGAVQLFGGEATLDDVLRDVSSMSEGALDELSRQARRDFSVHFDLKCFVANHERLAASVLEHFENRRDHPDSFRPARAS